MSRFDTACSGEPVSDHAHPLAGCCILVVEDEYLIAMEVQRWLQAAGAKVLGPVPGVERST